MNRVEPSLPPSPPSSLPLPLSLFDPSRLQSFSRELSLVPFTSSFSLSFAEQFVQQERRRKRLKHNLLAPIKFHPLRTLISLRISIYSPSHSRSPPLKGVSTLSHSLPIRTLVSPLPFIFPSLPWSLRSVHSLVSSLFSIWMLCTPLLSSLPSTDERAQTTPIDTVPFPLPPCLFPLSSTDFTHLSIERVLNFFPSANPRVSEGKKTKEAVPPLFLCRFSYFPDSRSSQISPFSLSFE